MQKPRSLALRHQFATVSGTETMKINLPLNALITALHVMAPAGATVEASGGSFVLKTTDTTPATITTTTISTNMNLGFDVAGKLAIPYLCDTRAKATVVFSATNVTNGMSKALVMIEGYW